MADFDPFNKRKGFGLCIMGGEKLDVVGSRIGNGTVDGECGRTRDRKSVCFAPPFYFEFVSGQIQKWLANELSVTERC